MIYLVCTRALTAPPLSSERILNEAYVPHGLKVVRAHAEHGLRGLMVLERRWREHFLTTMQPHYLPPLWSVDHNHSKFLRKYGEDLPVKLNWLCPGRRQAASHQDGKPGFYSSQLLDLKLGSHSVNFPTQLFFVDEHVNALIKQQGWKRHQHVAAVRTPLGNGLFFFFPFFLMPSSGEMNEVTELQVWRWNLDKTLTLHHHGQFDCTLTFFF